MKVTMKSNKGIHRVYVNDVLKKETNSLEEAWKYVATIRANK